MDERHEQLLEWDLIPPHLRDETMEDMAIRLDVAVSTLHSWRKRDEYRTAFLARCEDRGIREDRIQDALDEIYRRGMKDPSKDGTHALKTWLEANGVFAKAKLPDEEEPEEDYADLTDEELHALLESMGSQPEEAEPTYTMDLPT